MGAPTCPADLEGSGEQCVCGAGRGVSPETKGHCCWPGQVWASSGERCVGVPTACPAGYVASAEQCVKQVSWYCYDEGEFSTCSDSLGTCASERLNSVAAFDRLGVHKSFGACAQRGPTAWCWQSPPTTVQTTNYPQTTTCLGTAANCASQVASQRRSNLPVSRECEPRAPFDNRNGAGWTGPGLAPPPGTYSWVGIAWNASGGWATRAGPTEAEAQAAALASCNSTVGGCSNAQYPVPGDRYMCFAIYRNGNALREKHNPNLQTAVNEALQACQATGDGPGCHLEISACNDHH